MSLPSCLFFVFFLSSLLVLRFPLLFFHFEVLCVYAEQTGSGRKSGEMCFLKFDIVPALFSFFFFFASLPQPLYSAALSLSEEVCTHHFLFVVVVVFCFLFF